MKVYVFWKGKIVDSFDRGRRIEVGSFVIGLMMVVKDGKVNKDRF